MNKTNIAVLKKFIPQKDRTYHNFYHLYYTMEEYNNICIYKEYFKKKFYILSSRKDGLGNRLGAVYSAIVFAKKYKKEYNISLKIPIVLQWIINDSVGCRFDDICHFTCDDVDLLVDYNFKNDWTSAHHKYSKTHALIYKNLQDVNMYANNKAIYLTKVTDEILDKTDYNNIAIWQYLENEYYCNDNIVFHEKILKETNKILNEVDLTKLIGVHVRADDLTSLSIDFYINFIKTYNLEHNTIALICANNNVLKQFKEQLPNTRFIKQHIQHNSTIHENVQKYKNLGFKKQFYNLGYFDNKTRCDMMYQDMIDYNILAQCKIILTNSREADKNNKDISAFSKSTLFYKPKLIISLYNKSKVYTKHNFITDKINFYLN